MNFSEKNKAFISYANDDCEINVPHQGHLHININDDWFPSDKRMNDIFRMILDFCHSKSSIMNVPEDIFFYFEDEDLIKEVKEALYHIFHQRPLELEWSQFMDWYKEKSLSGLDKDVPWDKKQEMGR